MRKDPDAAKFKELENTEPGHRFRRSWAEMQDAVKTIKRQQRLDSVNGLIEQTPELRMWRLNYINASETASNALYEMTIRFNWPPKAECFGAFIYRPKVRPRSRKSL